MPCKGFGDMKLFQNLLKVFLIAAASRYPLFKVVDSLIENRQSMEQCTKELPCNYVRVFPGKVVPGTGPQVIRVYNGMERPLFMSGRWTHWMDVIPLLNFSVIGSIEYNLSTIDEKQEVRLAHGLNATPQLEEFFQKYPGMRSPMQEAVDALPDHVSPVTYFGMVVCRIVTGITTMPSIWAQRFLEKVVVHERGLQSTRLPLQHIPSSYINGSNGTADEFCGSAATKETIRSHMEKGLSGLTYKISLAGSLFFTVLHDWSLLIKSECGCTCTSRDELYIVVIGVLAFMCLTVTTGACFSWSSGALSVFVAPAPGDTVCFYHLPHLRAFFALATPLSLLFLTLAQLQLLAKSFAKGDFLYTSSYQLPFSYVATSNAWRAGSSFLDDAHSPHRAGRPPLSTPPVVVEEDDDTEEADEEHRRMIHWRRICLWIMDYWFLAIQVLVISPAGMTITKSFVEYAVFTINSQDRISTIVVMGMCCAPFGMFLALGLLQLLELLRKCRGAYVRWSTHSKEAEDLAHAGEPHSFSIAEFFRPLVIFICFAACLSLSPIRLLWNTPKVLDLFRAELWGNGGVSLFLFGISIVSTNVFSIRESLVELERMEFGLTTEESKQQLAEVRALKKDLLREVEDLGRYEEDLQQRVQNLEKGLPQPSEVCCCCTYSSVERREKVCWRLDIRGVEIKCSGGWHHELVSVAAWNSNAKKGLEDQKQSEESEDEDEVSLLKMAEKQERGLQLLSLRQR